MSGFHRRRHWFAVFSLSLTLVGCGVQDEISRAIDAFNRAVDALKQESSDWRTEARRSLEAIDGARTETLQQIHRDLSELVSFSTANPHYS